MLPAVLITKQMVATRLLAVVLTMKSYLPLILPLYRVVSTTKLAAVMRLSVVVLPTKRWLPTLLLPAVGKTLFLLVTLPLVAVLVIILAQAQTTALSVAAQKIQ